MSENKKEKTLQDAKYHVCEQCSSYCVCKKKGDEHISKCPKCVNYMAGAVTSIF